MDRRDDRENGVNGHDRKGLPFHPPILPISTSELVEIFIGNCSGKWYDFIGLFR
jgi:hypothetical protein